MPDVSPHRHISFTAHFTGYIWYKIGLSNSVLASPKGRVLAALMTPVEWFGQHVIGGNMQSTLVTRHRMIDRQLDALITQHPNLQVLELACGLSPRGWRYRQQYPQMNYSEADLPEMATAKRAALAQLEHPLPNIYAVDLFTPTLDNLLMQFDHSKPLVIITEGLINYFSKEMHHLLWHKLSTALKTYPAGYYLTDLYPEPTQHKLASIIWNSSKLLKVMSKSAFSFHYTTPAEATQAFGIDDFKAQVFQPSDNQNPEQPQHLGDLVWVVQAQV